MFLKMPLKRDMDLYACLSLVCRNQVRGDCQATIAANYRIERLTAANQSGQLDQIGEPHGAAQVPEHLAFVPPRHDEADAAPGLAREPPLEQVGVRVGRYAVSTTMRRHYLGSVDLDRPEVRTFFLDAGELFRPSGALVIQSREAGVLALPEILEIEERYQAEYRHFQTHLRRSLTEMHPEGEARVLQRALLEVDEGIRALDAKFEQHCQGQRTGAFQALASGALAIVLYATGVDASSFLTSALASTSLGKLVSFAPDLRQVPGAIRQSPFFVPWLISREARGL